MTTKDDARSKIAELVDRFSADKDTADYNEGQMRHYYILPLFEALGWDTSNPADMTAEEHISGGFVDFGFYINSVTAFFLETKRARKRLDKTENITQAINYSYLKGVTWAVLTDFQRLMVFNADIKVKVRKPMDAVFLDIDYKDLAGERFDDLWLLSKPAMQTREIDDLATRYGKKPKKQPVTDKLFADLTQWRRALFREMYVQGTTLWAQDIRKVDGLP